MIANLKKSKKKGFTLVELIVVIAIIAIIAAVAVPTTIKYVNEARVSTAQNEANNLISAIEPGFTSIVSTGDGVLDREAFQNILNSSMPTVQNVKNVVVTVDGTTSFTVKVVTEIGGEADVTKQYLVSTYGFSSLGSDLAGTYEPTGTGSGVWQVGAASTEE